MTILIAGWAAVVAVVLAAVARVWRPGLNRSIGAWGPAVIMAAWVIMTGALAYDDAIAKKAWTGATLIIPIIGLKAVLLSVLAYFAGFTILKAQHAASTGALAWALPVVLAAVCLYAIGSDAFALREMAAERHAARADLTESDVANLAKRVETGSAFDDEKLAFITNPKCPPALLQSAVIAADINMRIAATRNPALPMDELLKLARDPAASVRLYAVYSDRLFSEDYAALVGDPDENVREALAWKKELPDTDFTALLLDSSERVRKTAESRWSYRTGPSEEEVRRAYDARQQKPAS
ncbi:MAG: hypothetical protein JNM81_10325 [Rhodospirillaceae bacterium]|nr:hypothetical protein [Rhodospirillaceae bacterium]